MEGMIVKWLSILAASAFLTSNWSAHAHDFWIETETPPHERAASVSVIAKTGHGADQSNWPIVPHRITTLKSIGPGGVRDHQAAIMDAVQTGWFRFLDLGQGTHILAIESNNSYSELPAETFNVYIEEEGILPILRDREAAEKKHRDGKELYSRRGKTLVSVGPQTDANPHLTTPIGMTLEITPLQDPFGIAPGSPIQVQVHYQGRPVDRATIHVTKLDEPDISTTLVTGSSGIAEMPELASGRWLFHTVWSSPAQGLLNDADYITVFSSLTFDISAAHQ